MLGSSLPPVVCRRAHVLFTLFVFACVLWCPTNTVLCFSSSCVHYVANFSGLSFFIAPSVFSNVYLPVSLDCPFLIAPSVFSNIYLSVSLDCPFLIAPSVFSNIYFSVSLDCPFLIVASVFSNIYLPFSPRCRLLLL